MRQGRFNRPPRPSGKQPRKTLAELRAGVGEAAINVRRALGLVWAAHPKATILMGLVTLVSAVLPAGQAFAGKLIIDAVVRSMNSARDAGTVNMGQLGPQIAPYLLLEFTLMMLGQVMDQARTLTEHVLHARLAHHVNTAIIRKSLALDLHYFEDATYYDKLQNAQREADYRALNIVNSSFLLVQNIITLTSFAIILIAFNPLIALVLFGASLPSFLAQTRFSRLSFRLLSWRAPEARRMYYWERLLTQDSAAKEVKLFNLGEPLLARYEKLFWKFYAEDTDLAKKRSLTSLLFGMVASLVYYGAYAYVALRAMGGTISLGDMTLYLALFRQSQGAFRGMFSNLSSLYESALFMSNLFGFLELTPAMPAAANPRPVPHPIKQGIEFRNVSFKYPNRPEAVLKNVNLFMRPGEKIALVGSNGAGKTTLIKLLTRLYDPSEGQILLDGVDLREYDLNDLRDSIGVIFQDFVRYQATAKENISFGQIKALEDDLRIEGAAERGGASEVIDGLPDKWETMLGQMFERGTELSGGQWQKMALGRAFMRDGEVLVLDEPTAALDAEREYEIFQRFRDLTTGKIAVLISHRFSTVRMADRIAVLEDGAITELGSHAELLALNGTYARLFNMQAEGYR